MVSVQFVCLGNICRSPAAHAVFRDRVSKAGLSERIAVNSAGTGSWHIGKPPDARMVRAAEARGYQMLDLRAEKVTDADIERHDLVLAMDEQNLEDLRLMANRLQQEKIRLFMSFTPGFDTCREVPDPYYAQASSFDRVLDLVEEASDGLLAYLTSRFDLDG
jgi:protein-tyrosine phosphatase